MIKGHFGAAVQKAKDDAERMEQIYRGIRQSGRDLYTVSPGNTYLIALPDVRRKSRQIDVSGGAGVDFETMIDLNPEDIKQIGIQLTPFEVKRLKAEGNKMSPFMTRPNSTSFSLQSLEEAAFGRMPTIDYNRD